MFCVRLKEGEKMVFEGKKNAKSLKMVFNEEVESDEDTAIRVNVDIFTDSMFFSELRMQNYLRKRGNVLKCNRMHSRCSYWLEMEFSEGEQADGFLRKMKRYVPGIVDWKIGFVGHRLL